MIIKQSSPNLGKSTHSINQYQQSRKTSESFPRREVLWNIIEPGDPYDIRKSAINRIHNDSKKFMGDNPEMVCLLQAAQIQRLNEFLSDYSHKYRDLERRELDRHSYEVQIKELHQQLNSYSELSIQNSKMNEFIKKLTQENQYLRNRGGGETNLRMNYDSALREIQTMGDLNVNVRKQNQTLKFDLHNLKARLQIIESTKNRQIQELRNQLSFAPVYQGSVSDTNIQIANLKIRYQSQITRQQHEIRRILEQLEQKNFQIRELNNKNNYLLREVEEFGSKLQQQKSQQHPEESHHNEHAQQAKIALLSQQIQRLNMLLKQNNIIIQEKNYNQYLLNERYTRIETQYNQINQAYRLLQSQYQNVQMEKQRNKSYSGASTDRSEFQINRLNLQIKRLNQEKINTQRNYNKLEQKLNQLQYYYNADRVTSSQSQQQARQLKNINQNQSIRISELQSKINHLNSILQNESYNKNTQINQLTSLQTQYKNLQNQYDAFRNNHQQKSQSVISNYESQLHEIRKYYEERLFRMNNTTNQTAMNADKIRIQFQNRIANITREINRLNGIVEERNQENNTLRNTVYSLQQKIYEQYQVEATRKNNQFESIIRQLKSKIEGYSARQIQNQHKIRRMYELERELELLSRERQNLRRDLDNMRNQSLNLRRELENRVRNQGNVNKSIENYGQQIRKLSQDNENLRRELQNMSQFRNRANQHQNRIMILQRELQNVNQTLRQRVETINRSETIIMNLKQDLQRTRNSHNEQLAVLNKQNHNQQNSISKQLRNMQQTIQNLRRQNSQLINTQKQTHMEHNKSQNNMNINLQETRQQLTKIQYNLQTKIQEFNKAQEIINNQKNIISKLQLTIQELQRTIQEKYEGEYRRNTTMMEQNSRRMQYQLDQLRRKNNQLENRIRIQQGQFDRLRQQLATLHSEKQNLTIQIRRINEDSHSKINMSKMQTNNLQNERSRLTNRIKQLENVHIFNLNRTNEQLTKQIFELQMKNKNLLNQLQFNKKNLALTSHQQVIFNYEQRSRQLQNQIQVWQNKYKELELGLPRKFQQQMKQKISLYQQQINELNQELGLLKNRNSDLQRKNQNYQNDLQRLNENLRMQNMDASKALNSRLREQQTILLERLQIQSSKKFQIYEQNITMLQNQIQGRMRRDGEYEREIQRLKKNNEELNFHVLELQNQNQLISNHLQNYQQRASDLENELNNLQRNRQELQSQLSVLRSGTDTKIINKPLSPYENEEFVEYRRTSQMRYAEYESKIRYLQQQNSNLSQNVMHKNQEMTKMSSQIWNLKSQLDQIKNQLSEYQKSPPPNLNIEEEARNSRLKEQITTNNYYYQNQINDLTQRLDTQNKESMKEKLKLQNKIGILKDEIQRLNEVINSLNKVNSNTPSPSDSTQLLQIQSKLQSSNNKILKYEGQIQRLNSLINEKEQYILNLRNQIHSFTIQIESYKRLVSTNQPNNTNILYEIDNLKSLLKKKTGQYNQLMLRYRELVAIEQEFIQINQSYQSSKKHIIHYQQSIKKLYAEFNRVQKVLTEMKEQRQQIFNKNQMLKVQVEKMKKQNSSKSEQINELRLNLADQYSLEKRIKQYMSLMVVLFAEIQTLRNQLIDSEREMKEVKRSIVVPHHASSRMSEKVR